MITYNSAIAALIAVTLVNGFFSTNMFKKYGNMYSNQITELRLTNEKLKHRTVIGPMFIVKHKILHELFKLDFNKVLPTNKNGMQQMERLWGYVFQYLGYDNDDLYNNALLKGVEDDYDNSRLIDGKKCSPLSEYNLKFHIDKPANIESKTFTTLIMDSTFFGPKVPKSKYPIIKYWYDRK